MSQTSSRPRRSLAVAATTFLLLAATACSEGGASEDDTITLRLAHYLPTSTEITVDGIEVWMEEVEERTDGRVEFEYYPAGQLVAAEEIYSSLKSGVIDVAAFTPAVSASAELPLSDIATVPGFDVASSGEAQTAYWDLLNGDLYDLEWREQGIRPVLAGITGLYQFTNVGEPRTSLADWRGATVRSAGGVIDFVIEGIGGAPVNIPGPEIYEALQRGTADAAILSIESFPAFDFNEVLGSATTNAPLGASMTVMGISDQAWNDLPEEVRTALEEASEVAQQSVADSLAEVKERVLDETGDEVDYYELDSAALAELDPALAEARDRWIEQREDAGSPGADVAAAWSAALERAREAQ